MERRTFLRVGVLGTVLLAAGGGAALLAHRDPLVDRAQVLRAVIPALLDGALPDSSVSARSAAIERSLAATITAIEQLPPHLGKEIGQLFTLLALPPTRIALAGITRDWADASPHDVSGFLESWRGHRIGLFRSGYQALHDLVLGAWYADASSWSAIGYDGPPTL